VLFTEAFSVCLFLLKVGMVVCVAMDVGLPYWTALEGVGLGCLDPVFPCCDGPSGAGRSSEVVPPGGCL
jgi:hypothetical protein